jgi:hypothetical protein
MSEQMRFPTDGSWGAVQDLAFASKDPAGIVLPLTANCKFKLEGTGLCLVRFVEE